MIAVAVRRKLAALTAEHRRRWRSWAADIAAGRAAPNPAAVIETASALSVADPGAALERDVDTLQELEKLERQIAACIAGRAELLRPWAGDVNALYAARDAAKLEFDRLEELVRDHDWNTAQGYAEGHIHRIKVQNPHLFPGADA